MVSGVVGDRQRGGSADRLAGSAERKDNNDSGQRMKLPFFQFFPADYKRDTCALSLAAKGGWIDVMCMLHGAQNRGTLTLPPVAWARVMGASVDQAEAVIAELAAMQIAEVKREANGDVTISSRRMLRESITREQTRLRVHRHRSNAACNATRNGEVTGNNTETRNQKPETIQGEPPAPAGAVGGDRIGVEMPFPEPLNTPEFRAKWQEYTAYRRERGLAALKPVSVRKQWATLAGYGIDGALRSVEQTIRNGWQGLFEPKAALNGTTPVKSFYSGRPEPFLIT